MEEVTKVKRTKKEIEEENIELNHKLSEMESQMAEVLAMVKNMQAQPQQPARVEPQPYVITSQMDKPCTLIHLKECPAGLDTSIEVNGRPYYFSKFGERRTFRYEIMQQICSKYRKWFEEGIFTIGEDSKEIADDFGIKIEDMPMGVAVFENMEKMPTADFERLISSLTKEQCEMIANTWVARYREGKSGYGDFEKLKVLNKYNDNKLNEFLVTELL